MPIVASRGADVRRLLAELGDPVKGAGAAVRLRALGSRVVPHAAEELGRLNAPARRALLDILTDVDSNDAKALRKRLARTLL